MNYVGKLYGKIGNKYFDTGLTSIDWDKLYEKAKEKRDMGRKASKHKAKKRGY